MIRKHLYLVTAIIATILGGLVGANHLSIGLKARPAVVHANWASNAQTVAEQAAEADAIVRVQVQHVHVRKLKQRLPLYESDPNTIVGYDTDIVAFTDSTMRVLEVYKGLVDKQIIVMQTGGNLPASDGDPGMNFVMEGDPIYEKGTEHILFLHDISGDSVHAKNRKLYVVVNPVGRYLVQGSDVVNFSEVAQTGKLPRKLDELVQQIKQKVPKS